MSVRAKRGTRAKVDEAAGNGLLKEGELIYLTDEKKFAGATGTGEYAGLGGFEIGDTLTTARNPGAGWLEANGSVLAQSSYASLLAVLGLVPNKPSVGTDWTTADPPSLLQWRSVAFGNGRFVAVADGAANKFIYSLDGAKWNAVDAPETASWYGVTYGNGLFVAVASTGTNRVATSPDGINWTPRSAAAASQWFGVTFGNGVFVAIASSGTSRVMTSVDGVNWVARTAAEANPWQALTYGGGLFVAVASTGTNRVMSSPDGITWTARSAPEANAWVRVCHGNGVFVAQSTNGTNKGMTSVDGVNWVARSVGTTNWSAIGFGNSIFVRMASTGEVATSLDGATWEAQTGVEATNWRGMSYGGGLFVAVSGGAGDTKVGRSVGYTYNTSTQFALPTIPANGPLKTYIKAA